MSARVRIFIYASFFLFAIGIAALQLWNNYKRGHPDLHSFGNAPDFSLTTEHHAAFSNNDFKGNVTIVDFIFTTCAGPCPLMSAQMQKLQGIFHDKLRVKLISFTVDPKEDTPEALAEYAGRFGANSEQWKFLTGDEHQIYNLTRKGFHLSVEADSDAIAHSTKFVLIDKQATIRGYYDSEDEEELKKLVEDTKTLVDD